LLDPHRHILRHRDPVLALVASFRHTVAGERTEHSTDGVALSTRGKVVITQWRAESPSALAARLIPSQKDPT